MSPLGDDRVYQALDLIQSATHLSTRHAVYKAIMLGYSLLFTVLFLNFTLTPANSLTNDVEDKNDKYSGRECYGRRNGLGLIANSHVHYERMRRHYANCTYLRGSLEITHLDNPNILYDLSFLSSIRVVTGYVLIALVTENVSISLDNLRVIRGDDLFKSNSRGYGLFVGLNMGPGNRAENGLRQLRIPYLREISNGDVAFILSPHIAYVTTIDWDVIAPTADVTFQDFPTSRPRCHPACLQRGRSHCWGPGRDDCQTVIPVMDDLMCHPNCPGRCYVSRSLSGCCANVCAGGCWGPRKFQCLTCKFVSYLDTCLADCPKNTYPWAGVCER